MVEFLQIKDTPNNSLYDFILQWLGEKRKVKPNLYFRTFSINRLESMMKTGTDRDERSKIGNKDGEEDIMKVRMDPFSNASQVTWVSPINQLNQVNLRNKFGLAIYDGDELEILISANGFCKFRNPVSALPSLVAVLVKT